MFNITMNQKQLYFTASHCMLFSLCVCARRSVGSSSLINQARSASPWTPTSSATPVTWAGCAPLTAFPHTTHTESGRDWCSVGPTYTALWLCMHICDPRLFVTVFLKYLLFPCLPPPPPAHTCCRLQHWKEVVWCYWLISQIWGPTFQVWN